MERVLKVTNALLAVIAVCLVLIVAKVYKVEVPATAQAEGASAAKPMPVVLMYRDDSPRGDSYMPVVREDGKVPTTVSR